MPYDSQQSAYNAAKHAKSLLKTSGWKIDVHNNCGWFWTLENLGGLLSLRGESYPPPPKERQKYHCMFSMDTPHSGDGRWTDVKQFSDPNKSIAHQFKLVEQIFKREQAEYLRFFFMTTTLANSARRKRRAVR